MAKEVGAQISLDPLIGDVNQAVEKILFEIQSSKNDKPFAIAFGGETTVKLKGTGKGGRNQELALRFAVAAENVFLNRPWCFLSGGTDGIDGPTDAAGGLVDNGTLFRIKNKNKSIYELLENNDSYQALRMAEDLILIGATGTNVADLQLLIVGVNDLN
jgi:hydroxypyruvate reductase